MNLRVLFPLLAILPAPHRAVRGSCDCAQDDGVGTFAIGEAVILRGAKRSRRIHP